MAIAVKLIGASGKFQLQDFTPTKWATAEEQARVANKLTRFILGGFKQGSFTNEYNQMKKL